MTAEELEKVEKIVNEKIAEAIPVVTQVMTIDEAKRQAQPHCLVKSTAKRYVLSAWANFQKSSAVVHM